jgi:hypothetical protein
MTPRLTRLEPRDTPALYASAGPFVYEVTAAGQELRSFQPFESPDVPVSVAAADGLVFVGAGAGGAPRVAAFDSVGFAERWSVFVGDPHSRAGVQLAAVPESVLKAVPHPLFPAGVKEVAEAQANLDRIPPRFAAEMADAVVYVFDAPSVVSLPEFAYLAGVPTGATTDGERTYDQVRGVATPGAAYVRGDTAWASVHEAGHLLAFALRLDLTPDEHEVFACEFEWGGW